MKKYQSVVIIPALNPDENIVKYIAELLKNGISKVIVVDDGSSAEHRECFHKISEMEGVTLLVHETNKGKGRALKDALKYYEEQELAKEYNGVITVDADGQHSIEDVLKISALLSEEQDSLILGERAFDKDVPLRSKFGNSCTRGVFRLLYGIKLHDTQTGLRGIPNSLLHKFDDIYGERYEYEMNMLMMCSIHNIPIKSVTIETIYIDNNSGSHFNAIKDSFKIYKLLLKTFLKYTVASFSASIIDILLFSVLTLLLKGKTEYYILFATIGARVCSSIYNFLMNKKVVFRSDENIVKTAIKYYCLCVLQMLASAMLVSVLYMIIPFAEAVLKIVVDLGLFFISYNIQQKWIFGKKK